MVKVQYQGALVTKWKEMYPDRPFPDPDLYPDLFGDNFIQSQTSKTYYLGWWELLTGDCCSYSRCCAKGYLDYECQFNNNCYLNLARLALYMVGFFIGLVLFVTASFYAAKIVLKVLKSVTFITKFLVFMSECLKCMTLGILKEKVYYRQPKKAQLTPEQKLITSKMQELDASVLVYRLDSYQKKRLVEVMEDYEVQESNCCLH